MSTALFLRLIVSYIFQVYLINVTNQKKSSLSAALSIRSPPLTKDLIRNLAHMSSNAAIVEQIAQSHDLSPRLSDGINRSARKRALKLSKDLVAQLEEPENVAVELAFSVSCWNLTVRSVS
jgi:hypothetical protein